MGACGTFPKDIKESQIEYKQIDVVDIDVCSNNHSKVDIQNMHIESNSVLFMGI